MIRLMLIELCKKWLKELILIFLLCFTMHLWYVSGHVGHGELLKQTDDESAIVDQYN